MMKYFIILVLVVITLSGCVNSQTSIEGRYQSTNDPDAYLELRDDGRYVVSQENAFSGEYTINGNKITLIYTFGSFEMTRKGNDLLDPDGEIWFKI